MDKLGIMYLIYVIVYQFLLYYYLFLKISCSLYLYTLSNLICLILGVVAETYQVCQVGMMRHYTE